jgi:uncharacterized protein
MIAKLDNLVSQRLKASFTEIADFCQRWNIEELALFGSILREDFRPNSDIDVLISFSPSRRLTWDDWLNINREIEDLLKRQVDLVSKEYLKNPYRRQEILNTCQVIYAAQKP